VLWSKNVIRIDRRHINGDDQNMRWECPRLSIP
jgi:hypothetical protein